MKKLTYLFIAALFVVSLSYGQTFTAQKLESIMNTDLLYSFTDLPSQGFNYSERHNEDLVVKEFNSDVVTIKVNQVEGVKQIQISYRDDAKDLYNTTLTSIQNDLNRGASVKSNNNQVTDVYVSGGGNYYVLGQHKGDGNHFYYDIYLLNAAAYKTFLPANGYSVVNQTPGQ